MKNYFLIALLISQAVSLVHIKHLEAAKKNQDCTVFYNEAPVYKPLPLKEVPEAELLPDIQSFDDALNGAPTGDLFPEVAEVKTKKRK